MIMGKYHREELRVQGPPSDLSRALAGMSIIHRARCLITLGYDGKRAMPREIPSTCREAAARFREWSERTPYAHDAARLSTAAQVLDCFGDAPVPQALLEEWDFER